MDLSPSHQPEVEILTDFPDGSFLPSITLLPWRCQSFLPPMCDFSLLLMFIQAAPGKSWAETCQELQQRRQTVSASPSASKNTQQAGTHQKCLLMRPQSSRTAGQPAGQLTTASQAGRGEARPGEPQSQLAFNQCRLPPLSSLHALKSPMVNRSLSVLTFNITGANLRGFPRAEH